ncbi:MAG: hypothetical protein WD004_03665 [Actinomycetota bacterium]
MLRYEVEFIQTFEFTSTETVEAEGLVEAARWVEENYGELQQGVLEESDVEVIAVRRLMVASSNAD